MFKSVYATLRKTQLLRSVACLNKNNILKYGCQGLIFKKIINNKMFS